MKSFDIGFSSDEDEHQFNSTIDQFKLIKKRNLTKTYTKITNSIIYKRIFMHDKRYHGGRIKNFFKYLHGYFHPCLTYDISNIRFSSMISFNNNKMQLFRFIVLLLLVSCVKIAVARPNVIGNTDVTADLPSAASLTSTNNVSTF